MAGGAAGACGALLLALPWLAGWTGSRVASSALAEPATLASSADPKAATVAAPLPPQAQWLQDVEALFQIAGERNVGIQAVEYQQEHVPALRASTRTLTISIYEDYPKFKAFLAAVLGANPHAALQEVRIDRDDPKNAQGAIVFKLVYVYRTDAVANAMAR